MRQPARSRRAFGRALAAVLALTPALLARPATAQPDRVAPFDLDQPVFNPGGARFLGSSAGRVLDPGKLRLGLYGHYQREPLVLYRNDEALTRLVPARWAVGLFGAYTIAKRLELAAHVPIVVNQGSRSFEDAGSGLSFAGPSATSGIGAPVLSARLGLLTEHLDHPFDLSVDTALVLPFGSKDALAGDDGLGARVGLGLGKRWGGFDLGADAALWLRPSSDTGLTRAAGRQVLLAGGAGYAFDGGFRTELVGRGSLGTSGLGDAFELLGALRQPVGGVELFALGGPGFGRTPGTPAFRVLAGLALAPRDEVPPPPPPDPCLQPRAPIGQCPLADWDGDGVVNRDDKCPRTPEDKDDFEDADGCPEPDNDQDGILDVDDKCPLEPGVERFDGCPPPDRDGDGVLDPDDACPDEPGPAERKGCPPRDSDGDGVLDEVDNCVLEPGPADNQGCPAKQKQKVRITREKLVILDHVHFDTNKATIKKVSFPLLDQVARVLLEHPEVKKVRVEGHTDDRGNDEKNLVLSQNRAESVRAYLMGKGVPGDRLTAEGFGEHVPIETNKTARGRAANRRVEFIIVEEP